MRLPQPLALQPPAWDYGTTPAGPAMTVLITIIARVAIILRAVALTEMLVQVVIWRAFYRASPLLLLGPAAALAWGGASIGYLRRHRPGTRFICTDTAMYAAIAFCAAWCVPAALRGEAGSWRFILVTSQLIVPIWFAPRRLSAFLTFTPVAAFAAGTALAPAAPVVTADPRDASLALLCVVALVHLLIRRMLGERATNADGALAAADRDERDQYVNLSENIERREQDRLLHDTVLNTLTAIARSGGAGAAISQCRQDIGMLERALSESGDAAPAGLRGRPARRDRGGRQRDARPGADRGAGHRRRRRGGARHRGFGTGRGRGGDGPRHPGGAGERGRARRDRQGLGHGQPGAVR